MCCIEQSRFGNKCRFLANLVQVWLFFFIENNVSVLQLWFVLVLFVCFDHVQRYCEWRLAHLLGAPNTWLENISSVTVVIFQQVFSHPTRLHCVSWQPCPSTQHDMSSCFPTIPADESYWEPRCWDRGSVGSAEGRSYRHYQRLSGISALIHHWAEIWIIHQHVCGFILSA